MHRVEQHPDIPLDDIKCVLPEEGSNFILKLNITNFLKNPSEENLQKSE